MMRSNFGPEHATGPKRKFLCLSLFVCLPLRCLSWCPGDVQHKDLTGFPLGGHGQVAKISVTNQCGLCSVDHLNFHCSECLPLSLRAFMFHYRLRLAASFLLSTRSRASLAVSSTQGIKGASSAVCAGGLSARGTTWLVWPLLSSTCMTAV